MPAIATLTPVASGPITGFTTAPWQLWGLQIPQFGSPPTYAQFEVEVLQPPNVDGNRYRLGGAHFPEFQLLGIIPATDFASAGLLAREVERSKGWQIEFKYTRDGTSAYNFYVKEARALANAAQILGATSQTGGSGSSGPGPAPEASALASVDISLTLQYFAP